MVPTFYLENPNPLSSNENRGFKRMPLIKLLCHVSPKKHSHGSKLTVITERGHCFICINNKIE